MKRFSASFLDRLTDTSGQRNSDHGLSLEAVREHVARDLEALLNTRRGLSNDVMANFPRSRDSVLGFGLTDFSSMSLVKPEDRADICRSLERTVNHHEPRLRQVRVELTPESFGSKKLCFRIHAILAVEELREPINFNATLHPVTQHVDVARL